MRMGRNPTNISCFGRDIHDFHCIVESAFFFRGSQVANAAGPNVFSAALAPDVQMVGIQGSAQAAVTTETGVGKLTNAVDVEVGFPPCSHGGGGGIPQ